MGRRALDIMDPAAMRAKVAKQFQKLSAEANLNLAVLEAQRIGGDLVRLMWDAMQMGDLTAKERLEYAEFLRDTAYGKLQSWDHDRQIINVAQVTQDGRTIGQVIDQARATADLYGRLDDLVRRKVPFREWPDSVRAMAEASVFAELEEDDVLVGIVDDQGVKV